MTGSRSRRAWRLPPGSGRPLVVHVHSTEFDRSGEHVNQPVYDIERAGMHAAETVIAVSHLTARIIVERYGVPPEKVRVVHNGIDAARAAPASNGHSNGHERPTRRRCSSWAG